jgi:hypothetical protein
MAKHKAKRAPVECMHIEGIAFLVPAKVERYILSIAVDANWPHARRAHQRGVTMTVPHTVSNAIHVFLCLATTTGLVAAGPIAVEVDAAATTGAIAHIHGTVNGPLIEQWWRDEPEACGNHPNWWTADFTQRFNQVGIPAVRAHGAGALDINSIWSSWPDYGGDLHDPDNYDFTIADRFVASTIGVTDVIGRFGFSKGNVSIEGCDWANPPPPLAFAAICGNIVAHFNHGWHWDETTWGPWHAGWRIDRWSLWNEPYYNVTPMGWWTGTPEDYAELYEAVVSEVKTVDPTVAIGPSLNLEAFSHQFMARVRQFDPQPPIDFVDAHMYGDSPLQFPWRVYAAPADADGPSNWEDFFEDVGLPRTTPLIIGEWNRSIGNYAVDGPSAAFIMCSLSLLADLAVQPGGLHHVEMAHLFSVGKLWQGATSAPQLPTAGGGIAMHVFGEHLALQAPNRLSVNAPEHTSDDEPVLTAIAGINTSQQRLTLVVSQYNPLIPNDWGEPFAVDVRIDNLAGGPFQFARWAWLGEQSMTLLDSGTASGDSFERPGTTMVGNTVEVWMLRFCPQDVDNSGDIAIEDLLMLMAHWGPIESMHACDITLDGEVDTSDLLEVIGNWGPCS